MEEIIRYFNEECIKKFIDLRIDLYKNPENLAEFITATRKETDEIARRIDESVIQEMNDVIKKMPIRKNHWYVEHKYDDKKLNGAINKIVYVHEGIVPEAPQSKRYKLVNPHYFCRGDEQDNRTFWQEIFNYIEDTYDVENVKRIYMNSDGGNWIKTGYRGIMNVTFVLDEYHINCNLTIFTLPCASDYLTHIIICVILKIDLGVCTMKEILERGNIFLKGGG